MDISHLQSLRKPGRKIEGHAAILLPFEEDGSIAEKAYKEALTRTHSAGLGCAVNMDTALLSSFKPPVSTIGARNKSPIFTRKFANHSSRSSASSSVRCLPLTE